MGRYASESNAVINATILDPVTLKPALFNQTIVTPNASTYFSIRGNLKINKKHTLVGSFQYNRFSQNPGHPGGSHCHRERIKAAAITTLCN
jgi:hypothetical protein